MIKRMMLAVALAAVFVAPVQSSSATVLQTYMNIGGLYQNGPVTVSVFGQVVRDLASNTQSAYAAVYVTTTNGTDSGTGVLDVVLDPTATIGRLSGTIQGNFGPITVDATYLSVFVTTNPVPYIAIWKTPGATEVGATYGYFKILGEFARASITSGVGNVDASGAGATAFFAASALVP